MKKNPSIPLRHATRHAARAFTLLEVLVVIAIIVVLASITIAVGLSIRKNSQEKQTRAILTTLDGYLKEFLKTNREPDPTKWTQALNASGAAKGVKFEGQNPNLVVRDGYGNPIEMIRASNASPVTRFKSNGPDGVPNNQDDIYSNGASVE